MSISMWTSLGLVRVLGVTVPSPSPSVTRLESPVSKDLSVEGRLLILDVVKVP